MLIPRDESNAASYVKDKIKYGFLPWDSKGRLWNRLWGYTSTNNVPIEINVPAMKHPKHMRSIVVHETNHNYINGEMGEPNPFHVRRRNFVQGQLNDAYPTLDNSTNITENGISSISNSIHERRASNAEVLDYLGVHPTQV